MLSEILTTPAKMRIMKLLIRMSDPICFRDVINLTNVGIRSAQETFQEFDRLKLVKKHKYKNKVLYQLIQTTDILEFKKYLDYEKQKNIKQRSMYYSNQGRKVLRVFQELYDTSKLIRDMKDQLCKSLHY